MAPIPYENHSKSSEANAVRLGSEQALSTQYSRSAMKRTHLAFERVLLVSAETRSRKRIMDSLNEETRMRYERFNSACIVASEPKGLGDEKASGPTYANF